MAEDDYLINLCHVRKLRYSHELREIEDHIYADETLCSKGISSTMEIVVDIKVFESGYYFNTESENLIKTSIKGKQ